MVLMAVSGVGSCERRREQGGFHFVPLTQRLLGHRLALLQGLFERV